MNTYRTLLSQLLRLHAIRAARRRAWAMIKPLHREQAYTGLVIHRAVEGRY